MDKEIIHKVGDLRVWWIPQVPGHGNSFIVVVNSVEDGVRTMDILARYDIYQFENNIKPDYCNAGGLQIFVEDSGEGNPGWEDWYDHETGEDDPRRYLEELKARTKTTVKLKNLARLA
jgi:hypothetical protein